MRFLVLFWLCFASSLQAETQEFYEFGPRLTPDYRLDTSTLFPADRLSFEDVLAYAKRGGSYQDFLSFLRERRPILFQNYVLLHESGSLQYADLNRPRVLLFGDGLIFSFAEDPRRVDRRVELMGLDPESLRFRLAEFVFPEDGAKASFQENPAACQSCHGVPSKPLWEPYDFWPNAFGSTIGRFATRAERAAYLALSQSAREGIYSYLEWYPLPVDNNRSLPGIEAFTQYVTRLQVMSAWQRWSRELPRFKSFIPAMIASLQGCTAGPTETQGVEKLSALLPKGLQNSLLKEFQVWRQQLEASRRQFKSYQLERYRRIFPEPEHPYIFPPQPDRFADEVPSFAQFLWLLEKAGADPRSLSLSQGLNPYFLSVPSNIDFDLVVDFARVDPELFRTLQPEIREAPGYPYNWVQFSCEDLASQSRQRLRNVQISVSAANTAQAATVLGECMSCHVQSPRKGPAIPFDRTEALRLYLKQDSGARYQELLRRVRSSGPERMPPYRRLSPAELSSLQSMLDSLR